MYQCIYFVIFCVIIIQNFLFTLNFKINLSSSSSKKKKIYSFAYCGGVGVGVFVALYPEVLSLW